MSPIDTGRFESLSAKAFLTGLISRVGDSRRQILAQEAQARNPVGGAIIDIGISGLVPHGLKGVSRRLVGQSASNARQQRLLAAQETVNRLVSEARAFASQYATLLQSGRRAPESGSAGRRIGPTLDSGSPATRLSRLERVLQSLSASPLIENARVTDYQGQVSYEHAKGRVRAREPGLSLVVDAFDTRASRGDPASRFAIFLSIPSVREPVEGAIRSLGQEHSEGYRQGLNSLRVAFDALVEAVTGTPDWKDGVRRLVPTEEERKVVTSMHHLLSRASHHGSQFNKSDLEVGMDLFVAVGRRLIERAPSDRSKT